MGVSGPLESDCSNMARTCHRQLQQHTHTAGVSVASLNNNYKHKHYYDDDSTGNDSNICQGKHCAFLYTSCLLLDFFSLFVEPSSRSTQRARCPTIGLLVRSCVRLSFGTHSLKQKEVIHEPILDPSDDLERQQTSARAPLIDSFIRII